MPSDAFDLSEELRALEALLKTAPRGAVAEAFAGAGLELPPAAPPPRVRRAGPAWVAAAAGATVFPAALAPAPAFALTPLAPNFMLAMAERPAAGGVPVGAEFTPGALAPAAAPEGGLWSGRSAGARAARPWGFVNPLASLRPGAHGFRPVSAAARRPTPVGSPFVRPGRPRRPSEAPLAQAPASAGLGFERLAPAPSPSLDPAPESIFSAGPKRVLKNGRGLAATLIQVAEGDSLYTLAQTYLGDGNRWRALYQANHDRLEDAFMVRPGQTLVLPKLAPAPAGPRLASVASASRPQAPGYRVNQGDSLYTIAEKKLGDPLRWKEIVALNPDLLRGSTTIYPDQILRLPGNLT